MGDAPFTSLRSPTGFRRVLRDGRRVRVDDLVVVAAPAPCGCGVPRLGLVVGRDIGGAVQRNRAKRQLREAFRAARGSVQPGVDYVILARGGMRERTTREIEAAVQGAVAGLRMRMLGNG
ncbi:MAG: ribonuclease P protein component [Actinomycetota bacterium]